MNRRLAGSICGVLSFLFILTSGDGITAHGQCAPPAIPYPDSAVHSHNAAVGQDVTFYVGPAQGTPPLYYQWKFNGVPVDGATNTWVTITNVQFANAGYYSVLVSNACGIRESFTNDSALGGRLTVGYAASILVPPQNQNVVTGQTATFSFIPGGTPPFTNNWYSFGAGYGINGTNTSFSLANVRIGYAGPVYLTCSNAFGGTNTMATLLVSIAPFFQIQPTGELVLIESNVVFTAQGGGTYDGASNTSGLTYQWQRNGVAIAGATDSALSLSNVQITNSGTYSVLITNVAGASNSVPAALDVRYVFVLGNDQVLPGSNYTYATSVTIKLQTGYPNGSNFYTLDGSTPNFSSAYYSGPFVLSHSGTLRALAYSADFSEAGEAVPVTFTILPNRGLTATTAGGGSVSVNPPGGSYIHGTLVTVTATPSVGWTFLNWLGDASGTNPVFNLTMDRNKNAEAVFATTLSTTVAGSGSVSEYPASALYPYGSTVRVTALPQPGNYFGVWGNAASGNTNPLFFSITAPTQTISSLFASLASNQVSLTVALDGFGHVNASPRANVYANGASVALTAVPDNDQSFLGWSGDASATANPLAVTMNQSKLITATFTRSPNLSVVPDLDGLTSESFRFSLSGEWGAIYEIKGSSNLLTWFSVGLLTNSYGTSEFSDPSATNAEHRFYRAAGFPSSVAPPGYLVSW